MKVFRNFLFLTITISILSQFAGAEAPLKILAGGPAVVKLMLEKKSDIEAAIGTKLDVKVTPNDAGILALGRGLVDGIIIGAKPEEVIALGEKNGLPKQNLADYQWQVASESTIYLALHPESLVKSLTREQITGLLEGKIKDWESITGKKDPVRILIPKGQIFTVKTLFQQYLNGAESPVAVQLPDRNGIMNGIKRDPNTIGFVSTTEGIAGFTPRFTPTEAKFKSLLLIKKNGSVPAQKLLDYFAKNTLH